MFSFLEDTDDRARRRKTRRPANDRAVTAITESVGIDGRNAPDDVARTESLLGRAGYLDTETTDGPTGFWGMRADQATKRFQKERGLKVDGVINPDGETIRALEAQDVQRRSADRRAATIPSAEMPKPNLLEAAASSSVTGRSAFLPPPLSKADARLDAGLVEALENQGAGAGEEAQVAMAQAVLPLLAGLTATDVAAFFSAMGLGYIGKKIIENQQKQADLLPSKTSLEPYDLPDPREEIAIDEYIIDVMLRPMANSRGDPTTQKGNDIVAEECRKILKTEFQDIAADVQHVAGAHRDGGDEYLREETLYPGGDSKNKLGSNRTDLTWQYGKGKSAIRTRMNTASMLKDGETMTAKERRAFEKLLKHAGRKLMHYMEKLRPGMDEEKYRERARHACRKVFTELRDEVNKKGKEKEK